MCVLQLFVSDDGRVSTVGKEPMGPLGGPFTAHPKVDLSTGASSDQCAHRRMMKCAVVVVEHFSVGIIQRSLMLQDLRHKS